MKINPGHLFMTSGISCTKVVFDEAAGDVHLLDAVAAFVTEESVAAIRAEAARTPSTADPRIFPEMRYGDLLLTWTDLSGVARGAKVDAGRDAGIQVNLETGGRKIALPFTGAAMLHARERILHHLASGGEAGQDLARVLGGIQGVLDVVMADPDPKRFDAAVIGGAFAAAMIDALGEVDLPVTPEAFGRKARGDLLRARISKIDPDHPDAIQAARPLQRILQQSGIRIPALSGAEVRSGAGFAIGEDALRRMVQANERLCRDVFGAMTKTSISRLSCVGLPASDYDRIQAALEAHRLSGQWVDRARARITEITRALMPGYRCDVAVYALSGRDVLAVRDTVGNAANLAYIYSWPSVDRLPVAEIEQGRIVNISPEEIPDEAELARLQRALDLLSFSAGNDAEFELEGILVPARQPRPQ